MIEVASEHLRLFQWSACTTLTLHEQDTGKQNRWACSLLSNAVTSAAVADVDEAVRFSASAISTANVMGALFPTRPVTIGV